ncbi:hypothetical protein T552_01457 [Pneumocystis carinii B80]|uniref:Uncharacterized protein n=1 Tax=Pneumocystis carinii (strain B80) TaxID=1408658 RepID=A0A0W4ZKC3_PNEC8|nr:hypothetical protein T552_01457 [Pneumocystis carinii B80]KTW28828.1 hypothetical protein T552_01457 [Pneumocystis carinii B80]
MNTLSLSELHHLRRLSYSALPFSFELSSYFMSVFYENIRHYGISLSEIQDKTACLSCGMIWIPGWTCTIRLRRSSAKRYWRQKKKKIEYPKLNYWVEYQCQRCGRITRFQREKYTIKNQNTKILPEKPLEPSEDVQIHSKRNANSRRRKKMRLGGLEGIIDKIEKEDMKKMEKGLSLEDFML